VAITVDVNAQVSFSEVQRLHLVHLKQLMIDICRCGVCSLRARSSAISNPKFIT
jgi:hypothetical protein